MIRIAINGLGRIGRAAFKIALANRDIQIAGVNDLLSTDQLAYLIKYDSVYGKTNKKIEVNGSEIRIDGTAYHVYNEKDPATLPWKELNVDVVLECTGIFRRTDDLQKHITAGAKHVILSAPAKDDRTPTFVFGVNVPEGSPPIVSAASCTTNCITPVAEVMSRRVGVQKAIMTTVHAYTSSQTLVDGPRSKWRRGRAAAENLVPTSTGAAKATTKVLSALKGKFDGIAIRGPVPVGSIADMVFVTKESVTVETINNIFREEADSVRYGGILGVTDDQIVSSDIIGDTRASVVDLTMTQVVDNSLVKVLAWYDNEWGYTNQMIRLATRIVGS